MTLTVRLSIAVLLLGSGLIFQKVLWSHLAVAETIEPGKLEQPLGSLPMTLGDWQGQDLPIDDDRLLYADAHLRRVYVNTHSGQQVYVWMAYSTEGVDRGHHPEVCMRVAGQPEDRDSREKIHPPGHEAPVQKYRFGNRGSYQWVYYWHYTFETPDDPRLDTIQKLYVKHRKRPPSITLEVFAGENSDDAGERADEFVFLLDAEMQSHTRGATRGSERLPVTITAE